ncbi:MAG: ATP phosphoribosyltransferase regulatory subunit [Pseudomonadales bacterium]|nr:ATP phosphoribosyltransferase regulatory subunit [Pseudomonadales bacterium]
MMAIVDRWLLPDGVEDVLPPQARELEEVRRRFLDLFESWGYDYVIPPMIEFLESLLTGTGRDLDLKTFKVVDLLTGRSMGVRADITPQVARIDAHSLNQDGVVRLCYAGTIMQSKPDTMLSSRTPLSVGAEMFGETSAKADVEIVSLMVESLRSLGFSPIHLGLGDVGIFRQLLDSLSLSESEQEQIFEAVQRKATAEVRELCNDLELSLQATNLLVELPGLSGNQEVLLKALNLFSEMPGIVGSIENLRQVALTLSDRFKDLDIYFDLSELRGYAYHTGIVFAAYVEGVPEVVAKGGRYDDIGEVFGRGQRGATGFSIDVRRVAEAAKIEVDKQQTVRVAEVPEGEENSLWEKMQQLRAEGYVVLESGSANGHDFELIFREKNWQLVQGEN